MAKHLRLQIEEQLRERGLKITPQRFAILEHLAQNHEHPTADEIFNAINRQFPRASRATVYNTVAALAEAGLIETLCLDDGVIRYDANLTAHHHFICRRCRKILDVPGHAVRGKLAWRAPHQVESYEVVMRGLCRKCR